MAIELVILGSGSAKPTLNRNGTSQQLRIQGVDLLIDCAEGTQIQALKFKVKIHRLTAIFISHLHGDHYLGLAGLLSTMHLLGRNKPITIYGPNLLESLIMKQLEASETRLNFQMSFVATNPTKMELLAKFPGFTVHSFPLNHRIDCTGFIFREYSPLRKLSESAVSDFNIPHHYFRVIKEGNDFIDPNGKVIANNLLTQEGEPPVSYAFCSDTAPREDILDALKGIDHLYHEATFLDELRDRARETYHSTALQAATVANEARVRQLLIGHYSSRYTDSGPLETEARTVFPKTIAVEDGMKLILGA